MSVNPLPYPLFDADNHLYETQDSLTQYLPKEYRNAIQYVQVTVGRRSRPAGKSATTFPTPLLMWWPAPERWRSTSSTATWTVRAAAKSSASRCARFPLSASPAHGLN
jgi:hypothetical protein